MCDECYRLRPRPSPGKIYKQDLMKLNLQTVIFAADAMRMLNGARLSVNGLYSIVEVDWLIAAENNFSSTKALWLAYLEGHPSNNTMGPVNARPLQDVRKNHKRGRFLTRQTHTGQRVKIFKQIRAPLAHVKGRVYPKQKTQQGDAERYSDLRFRIEK